MKKSNILLSFVIVCVVLLSACSTTDKPEDVAKKVLEGMKANDESVLAFCTEDIKEECKKNMASYQEQKLADDTFVYEFDGFKSEKGEDEATCYVSLNFTETNNGIKSEARKEYVTMKKIDGKWLFSKFDK